MCYIQNKMFSRKGNYLMFGLYFIAMICDVKAKCEHDSESQVNYKRITKELTELKYGLADLSLRFPSNETQSQGNFPIFDIRVDEFPEHCRFLGTPANCAEATVCTRRSGYYEIKRRQLINDTFVVECDTHTEGGDWIIIQRRQDGSENFFRTWSEYKLGFGDVDGEFFIGLDNLYALTNFHGPQELLIVMERNDGKSAYAKYDAFRIGAENEKYLLKRIGKYLGTAGDSLQSQVDCKFSTKDEDNDNNAGLNCAEHFLGAGWYRACFDSNLNGHYGDTTEGKGIFWRKFDYSLKFVQMMIRRRRYSIKTLM